MSLLAPAIFTVLHLFSGSGGLAKGFHDAGFDSAGNIDLDPRACVDLRNLCGTPAIEADIGAMGPADLRALVPVCPDVAATSAPCLPGDGLVMMQDGPRRIDSVREGELVLTHAGRFCRVDKVNSRLYRGVLHGLRLQGTLDTDIQWYTDEHPIWVRRRVRGTDKVRTLCAPKWVPAGKVGVDDRVGFPVPRERPGTAEAFVGQFGAPQTIVRKGVPCTTPRIHDLRGFAMDPALWTVLGAYVGDGDRRRKGSYTIRFSVGARNSEAFQVVAEALLTLGLTFSVSANAGETNVRIQVSSRHLWQLCGLFGSSSYTKHIPEVLMGLEDAPMRALVRGLRATDGSDRPNGWSIGSVSLDLIRGLQRLMLRCGVFGSVTRLARAGKHIIQGRLVNVSDSYTLAFIRHPEKTCYQFEDGMVWQRVKRVYTRETVEPVWNLEVEEDHTFCSPLIATHNCVGFSGCLPEATSKTGKYQDFNSLSLHGVQLVLEAWKGAKVGRKVPGMIIFENVPRIMTRGKKLLEHLVGLLHAEGYAVDQRTHDCGELGRGLAQKRRRYLLVARHMPTVHDFLRKPPSYKPLAIREVLWQLAPPRPGGPDHMHRLPSLSAKNWLRLACICAGGDWRNLPAEVWLYICESADLEAVTGIRWNHCAGRHDGKLGVLDWERPSKTIIGKARVCNTWNSVADPRVEWPSDKHGGRPDCYGMADETKPTGTIRGLETIYSSKASTPDPRVDHNHAGAYGMADAAATSNTIRGAARVQNTHVSIDDPRVDTTYDRAPGAKSGILGVQPSDEASRTILGAATVRNSPVSVGDSRVDTRVRPDGNPPRSDGYGMEDAEDPASTVRGRHDVWAAPASKTPGRSLPSKTRGFSSAPCASTTSFARTFHIRSRGAPSGAVSRWSVSRWARPTRFWW